MQDHIYSKFTKKVYNLLNCFQPIDGAEKKRKQDEDLSFKKKTPHTFFIKKKKKKKKAKNMRWLKRSQCLFYNDMFILLMLSTFIKEKRHSPYFFISAMHCLNSPISKFKSELRHPFSWPSNRDDW
jgi:hypothetical protein